MLLYNTGIYLNIYVYSLKSQNARPDRQFQYDFSSCVLIQIYFRIVYVTLHEVKCLITFLLYIIIFNINSL